MTNVKAGRTWVMPVAEFLTAYAPASGWWSDEPTESWPEAIARLTGNPADAAVIDGLREALRTNGRFAEPVRVDPDGGEVGNGMHRVAAAVLEGVDTITVTDSNTIEDVPVVRVQFQHLTESGNAPSEDQVDDVISWLRSFALGDVWVTTDTFAGCDGMWEAHYYCPLDRVPDLSAAVERQVAENTRWRVAVVSAEHDPTYGVLTEEEERWFASLVEDD